MLNGIRTERVAAVPIAVVRRSAPVRRASAVVPEACGTVWNAVKALGVQGAGRHVAVYLRVADGEVHMEIGVEVGGPVGRYGELFDSATPAGEVATISHFGPYAHLRHAHAAIRNWCAANARTAAGPNWEVYGHWLPEWNEDASRIRTDVFYLLRS